MAYYLFLGVISRFVPHPANFTPIGALILHKSKTSKKTALALSLAIMLISDIFLGFSFSSIFVYLGMMSYVLWGKLMDKKLGFIYAPILGSISFFVISNFGVWLGPWYDNSLAGLSQCYINAIPFFQNTLIADLSFTIAIYGLSILHKVIKEKYGKRIVSTTV